MKEIREAIDRRIADHLAGRITWAELAHMVADVEIICQQIRRMIGAGSVDAVKTYKQKLNDARRAVEVMTGGTLRRLKR